MGGIGNIDPGWGVTAVRLAMGLVFLFAGYGKLAGDMAELVRGFESMGVPLPAVTAPFVAVLELTGGALLLIGLASRWLGLLFALEFAYITFLLKLPAAGWDPARLDVMLLAGAVLLVLAGGGRGSVDAAWVERERRPAGGRRAV